MKMIFKGFLIFLSGCFLFSNQGWGVPTDTSNVRLDQQDPLVTKDMLESEYKQFEYSFEKPFIKINPYQNNPLVALVRFPTEQPAEITLRVKGQSPSADIVHTFSGFYTDHEIPVLGLYPNYDNQIEITARYSDGTTQVQTHLLKTPLINKRAFYYVTNHPIHEQDHRYYFITEGLVVDEAGFIRFDFNNGQMVYAVKDGLVSESRHHGLTLYSWLGERLKHIPYPKGFISFTHGLTQKPNGHFLVIGSYQGKKALFEGQEQETQRDFVIELDQDGNLVRQWDFSDILNPDRSVIIRSQQASYGINNWCHMNGLDYDPQDESVVISCRHMGMIKVDGKTNRLKWLFGPHKGFEKSGRDGTGPSLDSFVLTAVDSNNVPYSDQFQKGLEKRDDFKWPTKTHQARVIGNGLFSIFDNSGRLYDPDIVTSEHSVASVFKVDPLNRTVQQVWRKNLDVYSEVGSAIYYDPQKEEAFIFVSQIPDQNQRGFSYGRLTRYDTKTDKKLFEAILYRGGNSYFYHVKPFFFYGAEK